MEHYIYARVYGYLIHKETSSLKMYSIRPTDHQLVSDPETHTVYRVQLYTNGLDHRQFPQQLVIIEIGNGCGQFYKTAGRRLSICCEGKQMNGIQIAFYIVRLHYIFKRIQTWSFTHSCIQYKILSIYTVKRIYYLACVLIEFIFHYRCS